MYNTMDFIVNFIGNIENAKQYSESYVEINYWKSTEKEKKKIFDRVYKEIVNDFNELKEKGVM